MKVFISWSGVRSNAMAAALRKWLPDVMQSVKPWMSEADIDAGARWSRAIEVELSETGFGVICLTKANQGAKWILFEAGAIAKTLSGSLVCPYLIDLEPPELAAGPLAQFQAKRANKKETWELVAALNRALKGDSLPEESLRRAFERWWPDLQEVINNLPVEGESNLEARSIEDKTDEILSLVRSFSREQLTERGREKPSSDLAESALRALSAVVHAKAGSLEYIADPTKPYKIYVNLGNSKGRGFVPIQIRPWESLFATMTSIWAEMQESEGAPEAFTYLWDWVLVRNADHIALLMGGGVTRCIPSQVIFRENEKWEVFLLGEPLLNGGERLGLLRGEPHRW